MIEVRRSTRASTEHIWALLSDLDSWAAMLPTMQQVIRLGSDGQRGQALGRWLAGLVAPMCRTIESTVHDLTLTGLRIAARHLGLAW